MTPQTPARRPLAALAGGSLAAYVVQRVLYMVPTLLLISVLVFLLIELPPGDYFESYVAERQLGAGHEGPLAHERDARPFGTAHHQDVLPEIGRAHV